MPVDGAPSAAAQAAIRGLIAQKLRYLVPMTIIFVIAYIGLTVLAGFAKGVTGLKVAGGFNLGFLLIAGNYLLSWVLAIVYGGIANRTFDKLAADAAAALPGASS